MKTLISFLLLVSFGGLCSCELISNNEPKTELEKLPPITQEGKNTFGYLVNGEAIVVRNTMNITAIYQQDNLQLGGGGKNSDKDLDITIFPPYSQLEEFVSYDITKAAMYYNFYEGCYYELENTYEGYIRFSKIDRINYIISGTFEFSTVTANCDTVRITDGRFDVQYTP